MPSKDASPAIARPDIRVSISEALPADFTDDFLAAAARSDIARDRRTHGNLFAGVEWLMPTQVVVFLAQAFVGAIVAELGKEGYKKLRSALLALYAKSSQLHITRVSSKGKIAADPIYSLAFSIVVSTNDELIFKLLIQRELTPEQAEEAVSAFLELVAAFADGTVPPDTLHRLEQTPTMGRTLLLAYDFDARRIVGVGPFPGTTPND
jgi:hypothetical protein